MKREFFCEVGLGTALIHENNDGTATVSVKTISGVTTFFKTYKTYEGALRAFRRWLAK